VTVYGQNSQASTQREPQRDPTPLVQLEGVAKRFGDVTALAGVDLTFYEGEVHAVLGANGAGKTTLMRILSGIVRPDAGTISFGGRAVTLRSAKHAAALGVGMVHQDFRLVPRFSVAENILLGWSSTPAVIGARYPATRAAKVMEEYGVGLDPDARVVELAVGQQQRVAIVRTLTRDPTLLILDEPTAVLTPQESNGLFEMMRAASGEGKGIAFITHKIPEALAVADRISVLRGGERMATLPARDCDPRQLAEMMIGRDVASAPRRARERGRELLVARNLVAAGDRGETALSDVSLVVHAGEIVAVAGISGNGQSELAEVLAGLRRLTCGEVHVSGVNLTGATPSKFGSAGVAYIPEDRRTTGMALHATVEANAILKSYESKEMRRGMWRNRRAGRTFAQRLVEETEAIVHSIGAPLHHLSGGNAQRLLVGRELRAATTVLIAMYPSQGLDVAASERVRQDLLRAAVNGLGVLLISEDLDEIYTLADTILVLYEGNLVGVTDPSSSTPEELGLLMSGLTRGGGLGARE
jgi:simple sugar transport system ATP-binding protein